MDHIQTIIFSSLIGALVAYIGAVLKNKIDTRSKFNDALFQKRTDAYSGLWKITKAVPKWPNRNDMKYCHLQDYSKSLNAWYFKKGGIYMSQTSQKAYADLQETIWKLMEKEDQKNIDKDTYEKIREFGSNLRTQLTDDLLSRRAPPSV